MSEIHELILSKVDTFLKQTGMSESTLGLKACKSTNTIPRLRDGKVAFGTIQQLEKFIDDYRE